MKIPLNAIRVVFASLLPIFCFHLSPARAAEDSRPMLKAAVFVQNRAEQPVQDRLEELNDLLTARLTEKGFSIIDKNVVVAKFRETRAEDDVTRRNLKILEEVIRLGKTEASVEDAITGASALRIAQMVGADYLIMAATNSLSTEVRTFHGQGTAYGTDNQATIYNLRISLKVLEGNQGGSVYADTVTASERIVVGQGLTIATNDILPRLLEAGAQRIADNIAGKVEQIRNVRVNTVPAVEFSVSSNVEGATVELDGAVIGTTPGRFYAAPGLHQVRVSKEWLSTWERTVNVLPNQLLNVTLELSEEGMRRYASIEQLKIDLAHAQQNIELEAKERDAAIGIAQEQSEAEAYAEKRIAEGEKAKREQSYERKEGTPTSTTNIYKEGGNHP